MLANNDQGDVSMISTPSSPDDETPVALEEEFILPLPLLNSNESGTIYVSFSRSAEPAFPIASFTNILKFTLREIDPTTNEPEESGYEDEYQVEDLELTGADYILPAFAGSFDNIWSGLESAGAEEAEETLQLGNVKGLQDGVEMLVKVLGMQALEGSEVVVSQSTHVLKLFGRSVGSTGQGGKVASMVRMAYSQKSGVAVKAVVRAEDQGLVEGVIGALGR